MVVTMAVPPFAIAALGWNRAVHRRHHGGDRGTVTPSPQLELATLGKKEAVASDTLPQCTAVLVAVYTGRAVPQP